MSNSRLEIHWGGLQQKNKPMTEGTSIVDVASNKRFEISLALFKGLPEFEKRERLIVLTRRVAELMKSYDTFNPLEDRVRNAYNRAFALLEEYKSAGSFYTGDNGCYILEFLDVNSVEQAEVISCIEAALNEDFALCTEATDYSLQIIVC